MGPQFPAGQEKVDRASSGRIMLAWVPQRGCTHMQCSERVRSVAGRAIGGESHCFFGFVGARRCNISIVYSLVQ